jgi:crotonobetainyl-CoA:carnitine CoA-transferase CaiB-like acyl-CoA transferase
LQIVPYQLFATSDGWLALCVGNDGQWQKFCRAIARPDLAGDPRFTTNPLRVQHRHVLILELEPIMRGQSCAEWERVLTAAEVPFAPVWHYARLFAEPQIAARGMKITVRDPEGRPVDLVGSPFHIDGTTMPPATFPPALGQDTDAVLRTVLGMDAQRIAELRQQRII